MDQIIQNRLNNIIFLRIYNNLIYYLVLGLILNILKKKSLIIIIN